MRLKAQPQKWVSLTFVGTYITMTGEPAQLYKYSRLSTLSHSVVNLGSTNVEGISASRCRATYRKRELKSKVFLFCFFLNLEFRIWCYYFSVQSREKVGKPCVGTSRFLLLVCRVVASVRRRDWQKKLNYLKAPKVLINDNPSRSLSTRRSALKRELSEENMIL